MTRILVTILAVMYSSTVAGCGPRAAPTPAAVAPYELPRGANWDTLKGNWKVTGVFFDDVVVGPGGTDVHVFLGLKSIRVNSETICFERLSGEEFCATYQVISQNDQITLHLRFEEEGSRGELGAIATSSGSRLVICFSLLKAPIGGDVVYPKRFRGVKGKTLCLEFTRR